MVSELVGSKVMHINYGVCEGSESGNETNRIMLANVKDLRKHIYIYTCTCVYDLWQECIQKKVGGGGALCS